MNPGRLQTLGLQENQLKGSIPGELDKLTSLVFLSLHGNNLTGKVPPFAFANITEYCDLSCVAPGTPTNVFDCPLPPNASMCVPGPPQCK